MLVNGSYNFNKRPITTELEGENVFAAILSQAASFVAKHGRLPRRSGMCPKQDGMAVKMSGIRRMESLGKLSIERVQFLDDILPDWQKTDILDEWEQ